MRVKSAAILFTALSLAACGDSNGPALIQLTQAQVEDMMDALSEAGTFDPTSGLMRASAFSRGAVAALVTTTVDETSECPAGGTQRVQGTVTMNDAFTEMTAHVTQTFANCAAVSSTGKTWTFNGGPSLVTDFAMSFNEATGAYSLSGTQKGALDVSSVDGSGRCPIDLTVSITGNDITGTSTGTITGTVCGVDVSESVS